MIHVAEVVAPLTMNEGALCPWTEDGPNEAGERVKVLGLSPISVGRPLNMV